MTYWPAAGYHHPHRLPAMRCGHYREHRRFLLGLLIKEPSVRARRTGRFETDSCWILRLGAVEPEFLQRW